MALSQEELAEAVGVSRRAIQTWEQGAVPHPRNLRRLAEISGAPVEWLLDGEAA